MDLYRKIRQKNKTPIHIIAETVGVTEDYVRKVLKGERDGSVHRDGKGNQIIALAKKLIQQ